MIKRKLYFVIRKITLIYFFIFPGKIKFQNLSSLNFKIIDFNNYKKNKNIIFKKDFYKSESNAIIYNYEFLNLCNKLGGKKGIELAKKGIFRWYELYKFKSNKIWNPNAAAARIINIVYNFDFINSISTEPDENRLKKILKININAFNRFVSSKNTYEYSMLEFKANILTRYILGEQITNVKNKFEKILDNQVDNFSMHKSYNLLQQAKFINDINEIVSMLLNFDNKVPEIFNLTKIKMEAVLAQYFHKDGTVALFNGTNNYSLEKIKLAFKENQNIRKINFPRESNGIFYFEDKSKKIFFDAIQPSSMVQANKLSAGTLSIEFSANNEKIITNCGALEKTTGNAAYLRYSAAHSTVILQNTNIREINENQKQIKSTHMVSIKKHEEGLNHIIEVSHNGYLKNFKKIVKRKINFQENKGELRGEDSIISTISKSENIIFHIRFHVMPNISITQTNSKRNVILKTKNNAIWLFEANHDLVLEESVFMDKNDIKETKQIVVKGITKQNKENVKWCLTKK